MKPRSHHLLQQFISECVCDARNALYELSNDVNVSTDRSSGNSVLPTGESGGINQILVALDISDSLKGSSLMMLVDRIKKNANDNERKKLAIRIKRWLLDRGYGLTSSGLDGMGSVIIRDQE